MLKQTAKRSKEIRINGDGKEDYYRDPRGKDNYEEIKSKPDYKDPIGKDNYDKIKSRP